MLASRWREVPRQKPTSFPRRRPPVTVCIAAICTFRGSLMVVAASDRMITAGDIQFEQPQPKVLQLGEHSAALVFGDVSEQATVVNFMQREIVTRRISNMEEMARCHAQEYAKRRVEIAEARFLRPLGLDKDLFTTQQQHFDPRFIAELTHDMQMCQLDENGGVIVIGTDNLGAHIYTIGDPGIATCHDSIGFVARGSGQWHAESQFMFSRYVKTWDLERAMYLLYSAKRRAEVAPGVGRGTDLVMITTNPRQLWHATDGAPLVTQLAQTYEREQLANATSRATADAEISTAIQTLLNQPPPPPGTPQGPAPGSPPPGTPPASPP
jgi:hypothetical protein